MTCHRSGPVDGPAARPEIMSRFFRILSEGVERFEGFVDKFTGDGIMALFGAPIAHEDHAQPACYAALHLRDVLKQYADELRRTAGVSVNQGHCPAHGGTIPFCRCSRCCATSSASTSAIPTTRHAARSPAS